MESWRLRFDHSTTLAKSTEDDNDDDDDDADDELQGLFEDSNLTLMLMKEELMSRKGGSGSGKHEPGP